MKLPKPAVCNKYPTPGYYTEAQMRQCWCDALDAAAKVCESTVWSDDIDYWRNATKKEISTRSMLECASEILKLKEELK